jgi:iron complex outermembrane receptor protein
VQVGRVDPITSNPATPTLDPSNGYAAFGPGSNPFNQMLQIVDNKNRQDKFNLHNQGPETLDASGHSLTLSAQLDSVQFKSITGYRKYKSDFTDGVLHSDGGTYYGIYPGDTSPSILPVFESSDLKHQNQVSQEFQAIGSAFGDKLNYVVGLYYFNENGKESDGWAVTFASPDNVINIYYPDTYGNWYRIKSESRAIYGQVTYDLTDRLSLTLGSRYSNDEKELTLTNEDPVINATQKDDHSWSDTTFSGNIDYMVNESMNVYFKIAEGYASGLYNPGVIDRAPGVTNPTQAALTPVDPEETTSYELGIKSMWLDDRLRFNAAAFWNDNDNLQVTDFVDGTRISFNSGTSNAKGVELELTALLAEGLTVDATYGYNNMDYDTAGYKQTAPKNTGALGIQYDWGMELGLLTTRLDVTYTDKSYFSAKNRTVSAEDRTLLNGRITLSEIELPQGELKFALWGRNLTDEEYKIHGAGFAGYDAYTWGDPRSYGVDAVYEF